MDLKDSSGISLFRSSAGANVAVKEAENLSDPSEKYNERGWSCRDSNYLKKHFRKPSRMLDRRWISH